VSDDDPESTPELASRLPVDETTIAALLAGQVDAGPDASRDIPLLAAAQEALRRNAAELAERTRILEQQAVVLTEQAALLDLTADAFIVRDAQGRVLFWNRGAELMYGWSRSEAIGRDTRELLKTEFPDQTVSIEEVLRRDGRWQGETLNYARDGRRLVVASWLTVQRDSNGVPVRVLAISHDITRQKEAEADLRRLTARLSLAAEVARLGVWEWDLPTNTLTWDATMFEIYQFEPIVPMQYGQWTAAVHPEDLPTVEAILQRAISDKGQGAAEFRILHSNGTIRHISAVERVVLDEQGIVCRMVGVNIDITAAREAEAELRAAKEAAEAASRIKSEFLANMSHEIRTPMNGVIGMTELLLESEVNAEQRECLGIVKSSADDLLTVINDILDFSRMEKGKFTLDPIDFSLRDMISDTVHVVALRAHQKGLELVVDIDADVPHTLRGDPGRLRQVLINLLGNAIKFTADGEIELRVSRQDGTPADSLLHFSVRDTGIGIPADRQQRVFEPFTQADGSVTRPYGGTGLGLTIASQLVDQMGGRLWLDSTVGRGSTFHFTASLPAVTPGVRTSRRDVVDLHGLSALIVDDNTTNRHLVERMVKEWGMLPTLAGTVRSALAALRAARDSGKPFPLVLSDVQMPDADSFALAEAIKLDPTLAGATVVMLTAAGQRGDAARCRELGIAAYLAKPIARLELRAAIQQALGGNPAAAEGAALVTRHSLRTARPCGRILLVEDNNINQLVARRLLERRGHVVVVTSNGREALALLDDSTAGGFGCVLMDVQMPDMDGFECTAIIRARERITGQHLPIIAMTAHAMKDDKARCLAAGMDGYLSKPIEPDQLFDLVDRYSLA
jgi:two-component system sensor histidine kinase/response regulator